MCSWDKDGSNGFTVLTYLQYQRRAREQLCDLLDTRPENHADFKQNMEKGITSVENCQYEKMIIPLPSLQFLFY